MLYLTGMDIILLSRAKAQVQQALQALIDLY